MSSSRFGYISDDESITLQELADRWGVSTKSVERWLSKAPRLRGVAICKGCTVYHGKRINMKIQREHDSNGHTED